MVQTVPFCDLQRALDPIRSEIEAAIRRTLDSGWFLRGTETSAFEEEWASYCGQGYAVGCGSGTDALTIASLALHSRTAAIPANTLPLTAIGLSRGGSDVRLLDVGGDGRLIEVPPDAVPVLLYGRPPSASEITSKLFDAAHAHGWKPPRDAVAAWSFYPTKTLGAFGDAGAVTTNDFGLMTELRDLCGRDDVFRHKQQITSRIDEIQAAVLRVKLRHLNEWLQERREIAQIYEAALEPLGLTVPGNSFYHLFVIRTSRRDELLRFLKQCGIETKVHWPHPLHTISGPWAHGARLENAEEWSQSILSLPCFPGLSRREIEYVCERIGQWVREYA